MAVSSWAVTAGYRDKQSSGGCGWRKHLLLITALPLISVSHFNSFPSGEGRQCFYLYLKKRGNPRVLSPGVMAILRERLVPTPKYAMASAWFIRPLLPPTKRLHLFRSHLLIVNVTFCAQHQHQNKSILFWKKMKKRNAKHRTNKSHMCQELCFFSPTFPNRDFHRTK